MSNEGKALVLVPFDAPRNTAEDTGGDAPEPRLVKRAEPDPVSVYEARIADMEARTTELRADLDQARQDRDRERDERLVERGRADKLVALAGRFATASDDARSRETALEARLTASTEEARAHETALQTKLDAVRGEMFALQSRPWWRRLAG